VFDNPWGTRGIFMALVGRQLSPPIPPAPSIQDRGYIEAHFVLFTERWGANIQEAQREIRQFFSEFPIPRHKISGRTNIGSQAML
jgi:hypothetical protein